MFSESELENPSVEDEEISWINGAEGLEVQGDDSKANLADLREGGEDFGDRGA